jgi:PKD repeat protein
MQHPSRKAISTGYATSRTRFLPVLAGKEAIVISTLALVLFTVSFAPAARGQANVQGTWQTVATPMPINPVHTVLMPNGKILVVSGSGNYPAQTVFNVGVWDPSNNSITTQTQSWDMFCNGMILLPDGRPFIMGGNLQYDPFHGWQRTAVYDPATGNYVDMQDMAHGRWYPTSTVLGDGRVMTFSGLDENGGTNSQVEIYKVGVGWAVPSTAPWTPPLYPRMHLLPNGKVFYSGSTTQSRFFDPSNNTWSDVIATTNYGGSRTYGSSVLLPLTPANNYKPKVMIFGGGNPSTATTEIIDLSAATPAWTNGPSMSQPRIEMNATLLPNGKILTVGGSLNDEDTGTASLNADLYDSVSNTMGSAGANAVPRLYHSVALLLPDATVWVAGGNPQRGTFEPSVEIYTPPYLYNVNGILATRPTITSVTPSVIGYGTSFQVQTPDAANIVSVVLMKNGMSTHAFDMEQRMVGLTFTQGSGALTVTGPPNGNIAPPGYYMLFLINNAGVPSVAQFVQVSKTPTDVPPAGAIITPATDVSIAAGQSVSFAGSGTVTSGSITGYSWSIRGGSPATSSLQNPGAVTFASPGTYVASLTVTDTAGNTDPSPKTRTITVTGTAPAPTLTNASPNSATQGLTNVNVILTGTNFLAGPACNFGAGIEVNSCVLDSATQITANIDVLAAATIGPRAIVVTNSDTQSATLPGGFTVTGGVALPPPTITGISPNAEFQGASNVTVTITGTDFQPNPTCNFDADFGGTMNTCTWVSATQINVNLTIAPNGTLGGHNVVVTNADGQNATLINGFTVAENLGNTVKLGTGFTVGALVLNGNAHLNGSFLEVTDGNLTEDSSAWYATRVNVQNFATDFTFQLTPGVTADGFTFALQGNDTAALGVFGGGMGYGPVMAGDPGGIPNSVAVKFDLFDNEGEGINSTGLFINGAAPNIPAVDLTSSGIDLHSGDIFAAHITYDGTNLVLTLTDTVTNAVFTHSWLIDIPTTVGAPTAYAGFTGGTGGVAVTQNIMTWTMGPLAPAVGIAPASPISFPDTSTNATSAPITITVTNGGSAALHVTGITLTGTNPSDFAKASDTCTGATVAPNATCTVGVTFTPSGTGTRQANLEIADDATGSPQVVALTGNGLAPTTPAVTFAPANPVMFPSTVQGATSATVTVTVTNSGNAVLNITAASLTGANAGDFAILTNTCNGAAVAANGTCTVGITFTPSAVGARQATLQIADNAPASPQSVTLSGGGNSSVLFTVSGQQTATVNPGQTATYSLQVTPGVGFAGNVTATCAGAPAKATCTVTPNPLALTTGAPGTLGVTVTTTATTSALLMPSQNRWPAMPTGLLLLSVAIYLVTLASACRSRFRAAVSPRQLVYCGGFLVLVLALCGLAGCASGGGSTTPPNSNPGTPAGTYTVTVTLTATNGTGTTTQTPVALTLVVN